jgi:hypothetical protein
MLIRRKSAMTGIIREIEINVTEEELKSWRNGALIQDAMPQLTRDDREFIKTGIIAEEWDNLSSDE